MVKSSSRKKPASSLAYPTVVRTLLYTLPLLATSFAWAQPPDDMVARLMAFDANKDGKLTKDEVPERMQGIFERADGNKDGVLTKEELTAAAADQQPRRMEGGRPGGPPMDMLFRAIDKNGDGTLSKEEIADAPAALQSLDKNGDGKLTANELRPQMRGGGRGGGDGRMFEQFDQNQEREALEGRDAGADGGGV